MNTLACQGVLLKNKQGVLRRKSSFAKWFLRISSLGVIVGSLGKTKKSIGCKMALMGLVDDNQPKLKRLLSTTSLVSKESARAKIRVLD